MELFVLGIDACNVFFAVIVACEFGQRLTNAFNEINDLIDQFQWYRFPSNMQRILPIALIIAQKPVSIEFFGSFSCSRELFRKVQNVIEASLGFCLISLILFVSGFAKYSFIFYGTS